MPVVNLHQMLVHARRNGYAVGSFALHGLEFVDGVLSAAEKSQSPVILSVKDALPDSAVLLSAALTAASRSRAPVALHLEAAASLDGAVRDIRQGCNGFTWDSAGLAQEENIARTRTAVAVARACGVSVGGTLTVAGGDSAGGSAWVTEVEGFIRRTDVDFLALRPDGPLRQQPDGRDFTARVGHCGILETPLAVDEDCIAARGMAQVIARGTAKIHCDDALTAAALQRCQDVLHLPRRDYDMMSQRLRQAIADAAVQRLAAWGGAGRAREVLDECRTIREVEHLIIYNVDASMPAAEVTKMMAAGRATLGAIPGVRRVFTGEAVNSEAAYRYCWLVRFADAAVIEHYAAHPDHQRFADTLFRPVAQNRISIDFESVE